jgi:FtsZ-binding cell division protein ZapB
MSTRSSDVADQQREFVPLPDEFARLERATRRLADELAGYQARVQVAENRAAELEGVLKAMSSGGLNPLSLRERIAKLEKENRELRHRMVQAQDRVRRLVARFDFLREEL